MCAELPAACIKSPAHSRRGFSDLHPLQVHGSLRMSDCLSLFACVFFTIFMLMIQVSCLKPMLINYCNCLFERNRGLDGNQSSNLLQLSLALKFETLRWSAYKLEPNKCST